MLDDFRIVSQSQLRMVVVILAVVILSCCSRQVGRVDLSAVEVPRFAWHPEAEAQATIVALHGFNDYGWAFNDFGRSASRDEIRVIAIDQAGFGARDDAGLWPGSEKLVADALAELKRASQQYPDDPIYLLGESMGGAVALLAAKEVLGERTDPNAPMINLAGVILVAPAVWGEDRPNVLLRVSFWLLAQIVPGVKLSGDGIEIWPTDNIEVLRQMSRDELVLKDTRIDALYGLLRLVDETVEIEQHVTLPVLILAGRRDELIPIETTLGFANKLEALNCQIAVYESGWHMLLRDKQAPAVWEDIVSWIVDRSIPSDRRMKCRDLPSRLM